MREILFRGKDSKTNKWVYGWFVPITGEKDSILVKNVRRGISENMTPFTYDYSQVKTNTVGQYVDLKDRNGNRMFEGDIVKHILWDQLLVAVYSIKTNGFVMSSLSRNGEEYLIHDTSNIEVVGNIHDNKELLK